MMGVTFTRHRERGIRRYRADWIPAYAGMTWWRGWLGDGAHRAPSWHYRADWIPSYAGMTAKG